MARFTGEGLYSHIRLRVNKCSGVGENLCFTFKLLSQKVVKEANAAAINGLVEGGRTESLCNNSALTGSSDGH